MSLLLGASILCPNVFYSSSFPLLILFHFCWFLDSPHQPWMFCCNYAISLFTLYKNMKSVFLVMRNVLNVSILTSLLMKNYTTKWGCGNKDEGVSDHWGEFHCRLEENPSYDVLSRHTVCWIKHLFACAFRFSPFFSAFYPLMCFWHSRGRAKKAALIASGANSMWNRNGRVENTWTWYSDSVGLGADSNNNPSSCGRVSGRDKPLSAIVKKTVNILRLSLSSCTFNQTFFVPSHVSQSISPVVSDAVMGSEVTSACIVIRLMVYGVDGNSPWTRDAVLEPSSVTLDVSVPSEEL